MSRPILGSAILLTLALALVTPATVFAGEVDCVPTPAPEAVGERSIVPPDDLPEVVPTSSHDYCCSWTHDRTTYIGGTCYYRTWQGQWVEGGWYIVEYQDCTSCPCSQDRSLWNCGAWYYAGSFCQQKQ